MSGCPESKLALLGIFSMDSEANLARRSLLREKYRQLQAQLPSYAQIDFQFVMGLPSEESPLPSQVQAMEQLLFPHETAILDIKENMDHGKSYYWFKYAANHLLETPHPDGTSKKCTQYRYVAKVDDDSLLHFPRLAAELLKINDTHAHNYYVGRINRSYGDPFMCGMLYLLSENLVRYIATSQKTALDIVGLEDRKTAEWIRGSGMIVEPVGLQRQLHDHMDFMDYPRFITNETICLHGLKRHVEDIRELFDSDNITYRGALTSFAQNTCGFTLSETDADEIDAFVLAEANKGIFHTLPKLEEYLVTNYKPKYVLSQ
ncbi:hypothetical protein BC830DRAFT_1077408 [Chytriomyces sp. MP71]|nr:hypothetical protein BC830DRAFT_1077408 [Chytriomyces sp. MP71]